MIVIYPKKGHLLPKHVPDTEWLVIPDVHLGDVHIWEKMKGTVFVDIDGTVADLTHRRGFVTSTPKNWAAFASAMDKDTPIDHVIAAVRRLYEAGWTVVMMSGRTETSKDVTVEWLHKYGVPFHAIYMRKQWEYNEDGSIKKTRNGKNLPDSRRDDIVKEELLAEARQDGFDPDVVFDDRNQVVAMWRRLSIPVVQVAEGDF